MVEVEKYIETMKKVAKLFNENNIRYALAGGVVAELRTGKVRTHKDIDFAIFEEDIDKISELFTANNIDVTTQTPKTDTWADTTEHNITALDKITGTNIGFFIYKNEQEKYNQQGELVSNQGFVRKTTIEYNGNEVILRERLNNELQNYLFSKSRFENIDGINISVQPLAYIIMLKSRNMRAKDRSDLVKTTQLLSEEEIEEYNSFKNYILNIHYTAQLGSEAKEENVSEVKKLLDAVNNYEER